MELIQSLNLSQCLPIIKWVKTWRCYPLWGAVFSVCRFAWTQLTSDHLLRQWLSLWPVCCQEVSPSTRAGASGILRAAMTQQSYYCSQNFIGLGLCKLGPLTSTQSQIPLYIRSFSSILDLLHTTTFEAISPNGAEGTHTELPSSWQQWPEGAGGSPVETAGPAVPPLCLPKGPASWNPP